jgi:hypothetical protein
MKWGANCVTGAVDIIDLLSPLGEPIGGADALDSGDGPGARTSPGCGAPARPPGLSRDDLDADSAQVLDAFPARGGAGTSTIAVEAGVDLDTLLRCLGVLAGYGFIERCDGGWRLRKSARSGREAGRR